MFFAYVCLRPVAAAQLESPQRLKLWAAVFTRFFPWVWAAIGAILASGLGMLLLVGFARAPIHWHVMLVLGLVMTGIFARAFFVPYPRLRHAVGGGEWPEGARELSAIRRLVATNLVLGAITIATATLGRLLR